MRSSKVRNALSELHTFSFLIAYISPVYILTLILSVGQLYRRWRLSKKRGEHLRMFVLVEGWPRMSLRRL